MEQHGSIVGSIGERLKAGDVSRCRHGGINRNDWRNIDLINHHIETLPRKQRRRTIIGHADRHGIGIRTIRLSSSPGAPLIVIPAGAPASRLYVFPFAGTSESVDEAVTFNAPSSFIVCVDIAASTGAVFTSLTVTEIVSKSFELGDPLSVTRTVIGNVPGPCASVGVHVNAPLVALIEAPDGAPASRA
jgi:hypothetical protein